MKSSSSESKKVKEFKFYTEFTEIKDPPETLFSSVPTVNISDDMINSEGRSCNGWNMLRV